MNEEDKTYRPSKSASNNTSLRAHYSLRNRQVDGESCSGDLTTPARATTIRVFEDASDASTIVYPLEVDSADVTMAADMTKLLEVLLEDRRQAEDRQERMMATLLKASDPSSRDKERRADSAVAVLPRMTDKDDVEDFIVSFRGSLVSDDIPRERWKSALMGRLTQSARNMVDDLANDPDSSFQDIVDRLILSGGLTVQQASDSFFSPRFDDPANKDVISYIRSGRKFFRKCCGGTRDPRAIEEALLIARARATANFAGREFLVTKSLKSVDDLREALAQWVSLRGSLSSLFDRKKTTKPVSSKHACFNCGRPGHLAADCRSKPNTKDDLKDNLEGAGNTNQKKQIICFSCHKEGHKSMECPSKVNTDANANKKAKSSKRLTTKSRRKGKFLRGNEVFAVVNGYRFPITIDSGAEVSVVPKEFVKEEDLTGHVINTVMVSGKGLVLEEAVVSLVVVGKELSLKVGVVSGWKIDWTGILALKITSECDRKLIDELGTWRSELGENQCKYTPPYATKGEVFGAESEGSESSIGSLGVCTLPPEKVGNGDTGCVTVGSVNDCSSESEEGFGRSLELLFTCVEPCKEASSDYVDGGKKGACGSAAETLVIKPLRHIDVPEADIRSLTKSDKSLQHLRDLADRQARGYMWDKGLLIRERRDELGNIVSQICLPSNVRSRVLTMAHEQFGHAGKNRTAKQVTKLFYWPSVWKDVAKHCRSCELCQRVSKRKPCEVPLISREVVSEPYECVCVDLVGPMPKSKMGHTHILTYIDQASRWPEATPLRNTSAKSVINALRDIFVRNGFPRKIITDNGAQFTSRQFTELCTTHGIDHCRSAPYHPQTNGLVERLHGTLTPMIHKYVEGKSGNWSDVLPFVLYFLRVLPNESTGVSPYMFIYGFEPATPLRVMHDGLLCEKLEGMDVTEWVHGNMERICDIKDRVTARQVLDSEKRNGKLNMGRKQRCFEKGDKVLLRTPGMGSKLVDAWEGPYCVVDKCSPVTYRLDVGRRKLRVAHVNGLKKWEERDGCVKRLTTVVEEDTVEDEIEGMCSGLKVMGEELCGDRKKEIDILVAEFGDVLNDMPGLAIGARFGMVTGDAVPISQRPYSTPVSLRDKVDAELDWLVSKGFIRKSNSLWASPLVTVRKPDGNVRLCVDFRKVNAVTTPLPFYMPTIDEVIEAVGQARVISKLDLSKGYYQIPMEEDSIPKTAFVCHKGTFEFTRMPFGVRNAPALFQKFMGDVLRDLHSCSRAYIDDIVIYSNSWADHLVDVRKVLAAVRKAGLTVKPSKCVWGGVSIEFLGLKVGNGVCCIPEHRVRALRDYVRPSTKRSLRTFLGVVSYYRKFVKQLASFTALLTPAITKQAPPKVHWTEEMISAFTSVCKSLSCVSNLVLPSPSDSLSLVSDASVLGIGAVLQVRRNGDWLPAAYYSRQTRGAERRYSATELEALALVASIAHFAYYLYGREFTCFTDHKALCSLLSSDRLNPRLRRMALKLQPWMISIQYLPGKDNSFADALSRQEWQEGVETTPAEVVLSPGVERVCASGLRDLHPTNFGGGVASGLRSLRLRGSGQEGFFESERPVIPLTGVGGCGGTAATKEEES